ncbi:MAG TPA: FAD-dependent oxidoreductase [Woeseiaceae bacterium]|nr:FAD-dependent oxidoreductase [Woeseiaceae bacterium]
MPKQIVIAGAGHAAGQLVATLKQQKYDGRIVLIGDESYLPYQRPPLSKKFLAGEMPAARLYVKPESFYDDPNITLKLDTRVDEIDRAAHMVSTDTGAAIHYDVLILATGSRVRKLPGSDSMPRGVHYLRTIDDVHAIRSELETAGRIVIVGAGYIGLEVAAVARTLGLEVTVIEMADRVMSRVVSPEISEFYQRQHRAKGVVLELATGLAGFRSDATTGRVTGVATTDSRSIPADLVVVGVGIVPNTELAAEAGLLIDNGIVVDEFCRSSDPDIFAVGDCSSHPNSIYDRRVRLESVHNALEQAKTAAINACGGHQTYTDVPWFWSDQYDLKLQIAGLSQDYDHVVLRGNPDGRSFSCIYLREGVVIAIDAINAPRDFTQAKALIAARAKPGTARLADEKLQLKELI